jgi:3-oxoacyl-[acyl-carrier protein] reductase/bacilysin biosynthesis oxidoreductase BacG
MVKNLNNTKNSNVKIMRGFKMNLGLKGKRAIITGASRGIGKACALALAAEGTEVCITARNQKLLAEIQNDINSSLGKCIFVVADLTEISECKKVVDYCNNNFGGIDILINVAGAAGGGDILDLSAESITDALSLKSYGYLRMSQLVVPYMKKNHWGRVVNIAGAAGVSPNRANIPTSVANAVVLNTTRALSDAVSKDGILVNVICPGITNTERARDIQKVRADKEGVNIEELLIQLGESLPAGRIAEPDEIANVACFLSSEVCSYVFGSSIYMDGGSRRSTP